MAADWMLGKQEAVQWPASALAAEQLMTYHGWPEVTSTSVYTDYTTIHVIF